jgi:DNA-binding CsgD family transcriptional regulator
MAAGGDNKSADRQYSAVLTLTGINPEEAHADHVDGDDAIDILTTFTGVLSIVLAVIFTIVNLLLEPSLGAPGFGGGLAAIANSLNGVVFSAVIVAVLVAATVLNDLFTTQVGRRVLIYVAPILGLLGVLLYFTGMPKLLCLALTTASIGLFILIWGAVLSTLNSRVLTFMLMSASIFTGIAILIDAWLDTTETLVLLAVLFIISWLSVRRISRASLNQIAFVNRQQSIERHVRGKGNGFTLALVGGMFGVIAVLILSVELTLREMTLVLGPCLLFAGMIIAFFYRDLPTSLGDVAKRILALIIIIGLAPFPFLGKAGQVGCICFLLVAGTVNLILIIDSILETSRFNQISPFWIVGLEGGVFFIGVLVVLAGAVALIAFDIRGLEVMIFILIGASCLLQIRINNQTYPLFSMPDIDISESLEAETAVDVGTAAFWRGRVNRIATEYKLSSRQKEIMELLVKGRDLNYITVRFEISRSTAKTHISNLYRKMNVHSKQELIDLMEPQQDREESER